jgi:hypothetical protein
MENKNTNSNLINFLLVSKKPKYDRSLFEREREKEREISNLRKNNVREEKQKERQREREISNLRKNNVREEKQKERQRERERERFQI